MQSAYFPDGRGLFKIKLITTFAGTIFLSIQMFHRSHFLTIRNYTVVQQSTNVVDQNAITVVN